MPEHVRGIIWNNQWIKTNAKYEIKDKWESKAQRRWMNLMHSLEKGMANHFSILALRTPWTVWKGKRYDTKDEPSRSEGAQYASGEEWRAITNSSRKKDEVEPKQKHCSVVHVSGGENKVQCCKEQYCIGIWNLRSMNQGKLEAIKQELARVNTDILGDRKSVV